MYGNRESVRRVRAAVGERGISPEFVELEDTARSATDAAGALRCGVEQIVKSPIFESANSGRSVLVLASGPNRVSERRGAPGGPPQGIRTSSSAPVRRNCER